MITRQITIKDALNMAKKNEKDNDVESANELYDMILKQVPTNQTALKGKKRVSRKLKKKGIMPLPENIQKYLENQFVNEQYDSSINEAIKFLKDYPKSSFLYNLIGSCYKAKNKPNEAIEYLNKAINLNSKDADAFNNLGVVFYGQEKYNQAIKCYQNAIKVIPLHKDAYFNMGLSFQKVRKYDMALICFKKAIQLTPENVEIYNSAGITLKYLNNYDEAIEYFNKALKIRPDSPGVYDNLASTYMNMNDKKKAIEYYEKAIQLKKDYATSYRHLGKLKKFSDTEIEQLENLYLKGDEFQKIHYGYALAKAYEDKKDYDKSFHYLKDANSFKLKASTFQPEVNEYEMAFVKDIFKNKELLLKKPDNSKTNEYKPIFILGMPRSGTTLVEQIISSHSSVYGAGELHAMTKVVGDFVYAKYIKNPKKISKIDLSVIKEKYLRYIDGLKFEEKVFTDKMPHNFKLIGFILETFPNARVVHLNRDPMAICWSMYKNYFPANNLAYSDDLEHLGNFYNLYVDMMKFWKEMYGDRIYDLPYEKLTENQEEETRKLLEYCELDFEPQCLEFEKNKREIRTASALQVRKKIYKGSSQEWRNYEKHLKPLMDIIGYAK